jgi:hypothetical protein
MTSSIKFVFDSGHILFCYMKLVIMEECGNNEITNQHKIPKNLSQTQVGCGLTWADMG